MLRLCLPFCSNIQSIKFIYIQSFLGQIMYNIYSNLIFFGLFNLFKTIFNLLKTIQSFKNYSIFLKLFNPPGPSKNTPPLCLQK